MRVFVIGAGQVGSTIVEALHDEHEVTVLDTEASRLQAMSARFDVAVFEGDGTSRKDMAAAGINTADLVIACTSRDEVNLVAGMFARREAEGATTVIRTSSTEYVDLWREGQLDVDFVVSSELETAHAISRIVGIPAARQTDVFAEGQVQLGEFDVDEDASSDVLGVGLRHAPIPPDSKVAAIIRGDDTILPGGDDEIHTGDRIVVIGSPGALEGLELAALAGRRRRPRRRALRRRTRRHRNRTRPDRPGDQRADDRSLARAGTSRRRGACRRRASSTPPDSTRTSSSASASARHRPGSSPCATTRRTSTRPVWLAVHGIPFTIAIAHDAVSVKAFDQSGIDVAINPRAVTAEEIVRFAHDPRMQQVAMLEGNRYEVLDVTTQAVEPLHRHGVPRHARARLADRRDRAQRRRDLPARRRRPRSG